MDLVNDLIHDKNVRIKTASMLLIILVASVSLWSIYGASVLGFSMNYNKNLGTTFHRVTVNIEGQEVLPQIEPLNLTITGSSSGCQSCGKNQNQVSLSSINYTVQEQSKSRSVILVAYKSKGAIFDMTIATDFLWSHNECLDDVNRTAAFLFTKITLGDKFFQFYTLSYSVQCAAYTLTMYTSLLPLNSGAYNRSFVMANYVPANESGGRVSLELVKLNSPVTLSQNCHVLGKVAGEMGTIYSMNRTLAYLAERYRTIEAEAEYLAKLVSQQLKGYDGVILRNIAVIMDGCTYDSDCSNIGQGYVCLGQSCGPCFSCSQDSQCTSQFGSGWTCYQGCCRDPSYQPPPAPPPSNIDWVCVANCVAVDCICALYDISCPGPPICDLCVIACGACVLLPNPVTCGACILCAEIELLYCISQCTS